MTRATARTKASGPPSNSSKPSTRHCPRPSPAGRNEMMKLRIALPLIALVMAAGAVPGGAQENRLLNALPPVDASAGPSAREAEPFDPTGYWVSIVTEDWRIRMATPQVGDHVGVPL